MKSGPRVSLVSDELGPALCIVGIIAILLGGSYYALFYLSKPTVYPNPGVEAYHLPPATRILPPPRVSDAPEVAVAPSGDDASPKVLAQASAPQAPAKDAAAPSHKGAHSSRRADWRASYPQNGDGFTSAQAWNSFGYARQWDNSYRGSVNYGGFAHDAPARSRTSGGPRSPF